MSIQQIFQGLERVSSSIQKSSNDFSAIGKLLQLDNNFTQRLKDVEELLGKLMNWNDFDFSATSPQDPNMPQNNAAENHIKKQLGFWLIKPFILL